MTFLVALVVDPATPTVVYAATDYVGGFKSTNGGATLAFAGLNLSVSALAIDPTNPQTIYAGTLDDTGSEGGGVCRSTDGGNTCTTVNKGLLTPNVSALAVDPAGPPTVYAALWRASVWQATPPVGADADLALTLSDSPDPVIGTTPLTYTIAVSNAGPGAAGSPSVSQALPVGVVFDSASGSGWTCSESGGGVTCTRPGLAVGAAPNITVRVTPGPVATVLVSSATVSAAESDPDPADNSDSETTNVIAPLVWMATRTKTVLADGVSPTMDFYTLPPCRLVDTRWATGTLGGPSLVAGADRIFPLFSQCDIPSTARALSVNLTVTQPTVAGNLRLYPAGTPLPLVSSVNYAAGQTRGNTAIVPLNGLGELAVRCAQASGTAHLILDVNGYFE